MYITDVTKFRNNLFDVLDNVIESNSQIKIKTSKGNVVVLSENDYKGMLETIYILSKNELFESIKQGEKESIREMKKYSPNEEW